MLSLTHDVKIKSRSEKKNTKKTKCKKQSMKIGPVAESIHMELKIHSLSVERLDDFYYRKCSRPNQYQRL